MLLFKTSRECWGLTTEDWTEERDEDLNKFLDGIIVLSFLSPALSSLARILREKDLDQKPRNYLDLQNIGKYVCVCVYIYKWFGLKVFILLLLTYCYLLLALQCASLLYSVSRYISL